MTTAGQAPTDNPYTEDPDTDFPPVAELTEDEARQQAKQLREAIRYHDHRYYVEADPVISDRTYDALFARLEELEAVFSLDREGSPTRRVGGEPIDELGTVEHVAPMRSLDQSGDSEDVRGFDRRVREDLAGTGYDGPIEYLCEPKFDGLSIEVVYEDGTFERAATRGDGRQGDDVTAQVRTIPSVPQQLRGSHPEVLAVRGEVYMPRGAFQQLNRDRVERGEDPFANPRNAAAGTLRQLDPSVVAKRPLAVYFFSVLDTSVTFETSTELYERLPSWGLRVTDQAELVADIGDAISYRDRLLDRRDDLDYEIDGTVITVNDREACDLLGHTARAPRFAFAYKFPARSGETTVRDIVVQVGRTGRLTPVGLLDPVEVGGVMVSRASLHNPEEIARLGVGVGDEVRVKRAGDVIPDVVEVLDSSDGDDAANGGHFEFPDTCPACGAPIERDGPLAFCPAGLACPPQLERAIEHYASREGLDIEGLGAERIAQLIDAGLLEEPADLYELTAEDLTALDGWGETSAGNLLEELEATREPPLAAFLTALGIPEIGPTTARSLAQQFDTFDAVRSASGKQLQTVPDIGPRVAASIREFFESTITRETIDQLLAHVDPQPAESTSGDALDGETFVFTGSLERFTRAEAQDTVEAHGGSTTGSVSGNTDFLVVGEDPGRRKRNAAEEYGVDTIDEGEFLNLLAKRGVDL